MSVLALVLAIGVMIAVGGILGCEAPREESAETASWRCRRGWHGRGDSGLRGLALLCIVHRCPRCGVVWYEQVTP